MSASSPEDRSARRLLVQDAERLEDVRIKHQRVRDLLAAVGAEAVLLQDPANIAWLTSGADVFRYATHDCGTSVFVTKEARLFATNSIDSSQIFEREVFGLGFQLKQREWFQPHAELVSDLCRGRNVISDTPLSGTKSLPSLIRRLRLPLTPLEIKRTRRLSRIAIHAVEATAHRLRPGMTEAEVAGEVSHRLLKRTIAVARLQVCADGRNERFRHWTFGEDTIQKYAMVSCVARRWGLNVGVARTVCTGSVPEELWSAYQKVLLIHATGLFFSRDQARLDDVWKKVHRIYEKFGMENEWQLADQANVVGYGMNEAQLRPGSDDIITAPSPVFWHPSVGPAMTGDTVLCHESSNEQLTASPSWPQVSVHVKGREVLCPGILCAEQEVLPERGDNEEESGVKDPTAALDFAEPSAAASDPGRLDSVWEVEYPIADPVGRTATSQGHGPTP